MPTPPSKTPKTERTCFIAMPITTHENEAEIYNDPDHWEHVIDSLFIKAIEAAGFKPIRPEAQGSHLIHGQIIKHLSEADLVLCDISQHNPNVFFELGVRTSLNLPIALVRDEKTTLPFDTSGINTHTYSSSLRGWEIEDEQNNLARHIEASATSCDGKNPLWRHFGLSIKAREPDADESPLAAKVDILAARFAQMQHELEDERRSKEANRNSKYVRFLQDPERASDVNSATHEDSSAYRKERFQTLAYRWITRTGAPIEITFMDDNDVHVVVQDEGNLESEHLTRLEDIALRYNFNLHVHHSTGSELKRRTERRSKETGKFPTTRVL